MPTYGEIQQDLDKANAERLARQRADEQAVVDQFHQKEEQARQARIAEGKRVAAELARRKALTPAERAAEDAVIDAELRAKKQAIHAEKLRRKQEFEERRERGDLYSWQTPYDVQW